MDLQGTIVRIRCLLSKDVFGKPFLVKDELEPREWELTQETKKIGNYTAYKAIYTDYREGMSMSFNSEEGENEMETVIDTIKIEAWYTPEIPVSQGPTTYWGLPGLIMEVNDGSMSYVCTKVILNPEDEVNALSSCPHRHGSPSECGFALRLSV